MPWRSASSWAPAGRTGAQTTRVAIAPAPSASASRRLSAEAVSIPVVSRNFTGENPSSAPIPSLARSRFGRARLVPPPDRGEGIAAVFRHDIGMAEAIPARGPHLAIGPLRHHVVVPQKHPVERLGGGDQIGAVLGEDDPFDQL